MWNHIRLSDLRKGQCVQPVSTMGPLWPRFPQGIGGREQVHPGVRCGTTLCLAWHRMAFRHTGLCVYRNLSKCLAMGKASRRTDSGRRRRSTSLIASFWSQLLWDREFPPTHGSRFSHFSLTRGTCHGGLQPLVAWLSQEPGDPGWKYWTGAGRK